MAGDWVWDDNAQKWVRPLDTSGFMGGGDQYRHPMFGFLYTEGVQYIAEEAGAYWLLDLVGSYQYRFKNIPFQLWELKVDNRSGVVTMKEDSGQPELVRQEIEYTDYPGDYLKLYFIDGVLLLPSEY